MEDKMINEAMEKTMEETAPAAINEAMIEVANDTPTVTTKASSNKAKLIWLGIGVAAFVLRKPIARGIKAIAGMFKGDDEEKMRAIAKEELAKMLAAQSPVEQATAEEVTDSEETDA